jgi:hypothetical protein
VTEEVKVKAIFGLRGRRLAVATTAMFAAVGGIAYAAIPDATGVYHACLSKNGSIRIIDPDTDQCRANETSITFNQQGPKGDPGRPGTNGVNGTNGTNGVSPTVTQLAAGDPNCPNGGAAMTDAANTTAYVCNGANGQNGTDGQPFSGTFTSPNGQYSISVTNTGVTIAQTSGSLIKLAGDDVTIRSKGSTAIQSDLNINLRGGNNVTIESASNFMLKGGGVGTVESAGSLAVKGSSVSINGNGSTCLLVARLGDGVLSTSGNQGATSTGFITSGAPSVCIGG